MRRSVPLGAVAVLVVCALIVWLHPRGGEPARAQPAPAAAAAPSNTPPPPRLPDTAVTLVPDVPIETAPADDPTTAVPTLPSQTPVQPSAVPSDPPAPSVPAPSVVFNNPTGSKAQRYAIASSVNRAIRATPAGATITFATYTFSLQSTTDALLAASRRGVHVHLLVDESARRFKVVKKLTAAFGTSTAGRSFVRTCRDGCMSSNSGSIMHAKFYLFSETGGMSNVSMFGSANLTVSQARGGWNNLYTSYEPAAYALLLKYFDDMLRDRTDEGYFQRGSAGPVALYLYPKAGSRALQSDALDGVSCAGGTKIRIAMYHWNDSRVELARQVWKLHDSGCDVQIVISGRGAQPKVRKVLTARSAEHGRIPIFDAHTGGRFSHHKTLIIEGTWAGRAGTKVVFAGSQNFVKRATTMNNELVFATRDPAIVDAYLANFRTVAAHSKRVD